MMSATKSGIALGFVAGLAVAVACGARSMSGSADAGPADTAPGDTPVDTATADTSPPDRLRVRTADTDSEQIAEGEASVSGAAVAVAAGPVVITDIWSTEANLTSFVLLLRASQDCSSEVTRPHVFRRHLSGPLHGIRIALKAGEFLCMASENGIVPPVTFQWSGYRPYSTN